MGLKQHTIIFVPHARARFRKWRFTNRQLSTLVAVLVLVTGASIFTTWSFFTNTLDLKELDRIRTENEKLREVNQSFEDSIRSLQKQLGDFETRTRQLAIVAGLENLEGGQEAGIGGDSFPDLSAAGHELDGVLGGLAERSRVLAESLDRVDGRLDERQRLIAATPAIAPVKGILTSGFGTRRDPMSGRRAMHFGVDIATSPGRAVRASADGIVLRSGRVGGLGKAVYVSHGYGLTTRYGHLAKVAVEPGQKIRQGDTVGFVGSTGKATGYHLHYEVRQDGKAVDPVAYILESTADGS